MVNQTLRKSLEDEKLASFNIPNIKEIIAESKVYFNVQTIKWGADGKEGTSSATAASLVGLVFMMVVYIFIITYGSMVMQGVMEEKTNRIVELMISSVRPFELMMGKITGIALVGLTQLLLWGIMSSLLIALGNFIVGGGMDPDTISRSLTATASMEKAGDILQILQSINFVKIGIFFILYFIGGYLLYASLFAAIGSAIEQQEDANQFMLPIIILQIFSIYAGTYSMDNPDGPLAFWCSMIPFTSPIVMMIRIAFDAPLWELLLSVVILMGTAVGITWFSGKIYRVGILMYGKKPNLKELIKWVRY
jgi:ABC-2 type transport system permease protein